MRSLEGPLMADTVEKVVRGALGIYGLYGAISVGTASSMMMVSKMPFREFFNEICQEPTFRLDALWNVLALVTRQTDLDRCTPDLPVWEMSNRSPPVLAVDRRAP